MIVRNSFMILVMTLLFAGPSHARVVEKIIAAINDRVITMTDLEEETAVSLQIGKSINKKQALDTIIEREVVVKEAGRLGITVSMDEITKSLLYFEETFQSKEEFDSFLKRYEMSLKDLSNRFYSAIAVERVKRQKEAISEGRYEKWLDEALKKAGVKMINTE